MDSKILDVAGVDDPRWRKPSRSGATNCVEVAVTKDGVCVRDSKKPEGGTLQFSTSEWRAFTDSIDEFRI